jgi:hypothetical protein
MSIDLTTQERDTIRTAAFGSLTLVSKADPGFFAMFKESVAGSRALAEAPQEIKEVFGSGGLPPVPKAGSDQELEATILADVAAAVDILGAKAPAQLQGFKDVLLTACDQVAQASSGVDPAEQQVIDKIRAALGGGSTGTGAAPTDGALGQ